MIVTCSIHKIPMTADGCPECHKGAIQPKVLPLCIKCKEGVDEYGSYTSEGFTCSDCHEKEKSGTPGV